MFIPAPCSLYITTMNRVEQGRSALFQCANPIITVRIFSPRSAHLCMSVSKSIVGVFLSYSFPSNFRNVTEFFRLNSLLGREAIFAEIILLHCNRTERSNPCIHSRIKCANGLVVELPLQYSVLYSLILCKIIHVFQIFVAKVTCCIFQTRGEEPQWPHCKVKFSNSKEFNQLPLNALKRPLWPLWLCSWCLKVPNWTWSPQNRK